jgi:CheY-like chemotaxis protein
MRFPMNETPARVLACDDDPVILRLLQVNLELEGYDVLLAHNGEEAVEVATAEHPDLVLLDVMMPRLDGYQAVQRLKQNPATRDIPVIFLSARAQLADIERGKASGANAYMTKPFDPDDLLATVAQTLQSSKSP